MSLPLARKTAGKRYTLWTDIKKNPFSYGLLLPAMLLLCDKLIRATTRKM